MTGLSTHHQHIGVNFVHLSQEEAEQSSLRLGYLHFSILNKTGERGAAKAVSEASGIASPALASALAGRAHLLLQSLFEVVGEDAV